MWSANLQEKHIAMIAKSNVCLGVAILYYPFRHYVEAMIVPAISSLLLCALIILGLFWACKSSSNQPSMCAQYTDEYVKGVLLRSYYWTLNAIIPYLALLWFSEGWTYWLGEPDISLAGQIGFGLVLLVQGSTACWWLFRDQLSTEEE